MIIAFVYRHLALLSRDVLFRWLDSVPFSILGTDGGPSARRQVDTRRANDALLLDELSQRCIAAATIAIAAGMLSPLPLPPSSLSPLPPPPLPLPPTYGRAEQLETKTLLEECRRVFVREWSGSY